MFTKQSFIPLKKDLPNKPSICHFAFEGIHLIIVDEIDLLILQHLEQLRDIYNQHDLAMIFIGMPGIEK
ncbi:ATP-binding protein [Peribacillus simplex]|nr:ATP-binding protein [Peribacillus simplex]NCT38868.1 ATP-binding protein [Peribacillus frigoritolerans]